jgi:hypothetical protein
MKPDVGGCFFSVEGEFVAQFLGAAPLDETAEFRVCG